MDARNATMGNNYLARMKPVLLLLVLLAATGTGHLYAQSQTPDSTEVFRYVEQMPEPKYSLHEYLSSNLKFPPGADAGDGVRVIVTFVVDEEGYITNVKSVTDDVPPGFKTEAIRIVRSLPRWKPARQNGKPVKVYYTLPIKFTGKG